MDQDDRDDVEVERRLRAYATARLGPDPAAMARVRAAVLDAAATSSAEAAADPPTVLAAPAPANRGGLRGPARGRLRGRDPVPVFRWHDPVGGASESTSIATDKALAASAAWDPAPEAGLDTAAAHHGSPIGASPRVRRAELIPVVDAPPPARTGRWIRRGAAVLLAAGILLGGAVAVSAAAPDSPLYDARIALENLTLPAAASARAEARVAALQQRINEAKGAANGSNGKAVAAALKAYRASVKDALREAADDPEALAALYAALGLHVEALQTLDAAKVGDAKSAIDNALEDSQNAVTEIEQRGHGKPSTTPGRGPKG
jgi:hypothetical protein